MIVKETVTEKYSQYSEKELLHMLKKKFSNEKVKVIDVLNFQIFFDYFNAFKEPVELGIKGSFCVVFNEKILFVLESTNAVEYNAISVLRDLFNIFLCKESFLSRKDVEKKVSFQRKTYI